MSDNELPPRDPDLAQVNSSLNESMKTCRSMVADYRAFLTSDETSQDEQDSAEPCAFESGLDGTK